MFWIQQDQYHLVTYPHGAEGNENDSHFTCANPNPNLTNPDSFKVIRLVKNVLAQPDQCHLASCRRVLESNQNASHSTSANPNLDLTVTLTLICNPNIKILQNCQWNRSDFSSPNPKHRFKSTLAIPVS